MAPWHLGTLARWLLLAGLALWTWRLARTSLTDQSASSLLDLTNLVFHEAGHVIFSPFGHFMTVLGGSLTQVLIPLACATAFIRQHRNWFGAAVCFWWTGQSLVDVAPYIADARRLQMVLLGGRTGAEVEGHDWEYLLTAMGWLHRDVAIGSAVHAVGVVVMMAAIVSAAAVIVRAARQTEMERI